jgi:hypothetical protein
MIQRLIADRLEQGAGPSAYLWLERMMEFGFIGYANMSDAELAAELGRRKLDLAIDSPHHDDDPQWDEEAAELALQLRGVSEIQGPQ